MLLNKVNFGFAPSAGGTPFSITAVGNASNTAGQSTYVFTSQGIGAADATRLVVIGITYQNSTANTVGSVDVGGNAATQVAGAGALSSVGAGSDIWYVALAAGTTATITVNPSGGLLFARCAIEVYSVIGTGLSVSSGANGVASTNVNTLSASATIPAGGGAIGVMSIHSSTAGAITPSNLSNDANVVFGNSTMQTGSNTSSSGSTSMGFAWAGTATDAALSLVTFNP